MTFLQKAQEINKVEGRKMDDETVIKFHCPYDYGLDDMDECKEVNPEGCKKCWNREIPGTEDVSFTDDLLNQGYTKGINDAWELAKKIDCFTCEERNERFGIFQMHNIFSCYTPQEAIAKLKEYEEAQEQARLEEEMKQIQVGDVVIFDEIKAVVMDKDGAENVALFTENGCIECWTNESYVTKTGKHIDIQSILEQIGE